MSLSIGIVGLPNVGKSTLFNALLGKAQAAASNFPFCTIEPNIGIVPVPDFRLDKLTQFENSKKTIPATVEFVDIAGLVKGAHQGQGLGNQFLSHIRKVNVIIQVIRLFSDKNVSHISGDINPKDDIDTINTELLLADLDTIEKRLIKEEKMAKKDTKLIPKVDAYCKLKHHLEQGLAARTFVFDKKESEFIKELNLLSIKPTLYVINLDDDQINDIKSLPEILGINNDQIIPINAKTESELSDLLPADQAEYLKAINLDEPGLNKIIKIGYKLLNLITFFTAGEKETKAWTINNGALAPEAAGAIHTDFEKGFIKAEVINYKDLEKLESLTKAQGQGLVRIEGKDYIVRDGDVMLFKFNV